MSDIDWRVVAEDTRKALEKRNEEVKQLRHSLAVIGRFTAPGTRTFDDMMRDMEYANSEARLALSR